MYCKSYRFWLFVSIVKTFTSLLYSEKKILSIYKKVVTKILTTIIISMQIYCFRSLNYFWVGRFQINLYYSAYIIFDRCYFFYRKINFNISWSASILLSCKFVRPIYYLVFSFGSPHPVGFEPSTINIHCTNLCYLNNKSLINSAVNNFYFLKINFHVIFVNLSLVTLKTFRNLYLHNKF